MRIIRRFDHGAKSLDILFEECKYNPLIKVGVFWLQSHIPTSEEHRFVIYTFDSQYITDNRIMLKGNTGMVGFSKKIYKI